jgi:argininosuccinate lyase
MLAAAPQGFSLATEIADFLVRANVPFASAHDAAGKCVALCEAQQIELHQLSDEDFKKVHPLLTPEIRKVLTVEGAIASRTTIGATGGNALSTQLSTANSDIKSAEKKLSDQMRAFSEMMGE